MAGPGDSARPGRADSAAPRPESQPAGDRRQAAPQGQPPCGPANTCQAPLPVPAHQPRRAHRTARPGHRQLQRGGHQPRLPGSTSRRTISPTPAPTPCSTRAGTATSLTPAPIILAEVKRSGAVKVLAFFRVPAGARSDAVPTCVARPGRCAVRRGTARRLVLSRTRTRLAGCPRACAARLGQGPDHRAGLRLRQGRGVLRHRIPDRRAERGPGRGPGRRRGPDRPARPPHAPGCRQAVLPVRLRRRTPLRDLRLQLQHRTRQGMGPQLCPTGGQVVRIG